MASTLFIAAHQPRAWVGIRQAAASNGGANHGSCRFGWRASQFCATAIQAAPSTCIGMLRWSVASSGVTMMVAPSRAVRSHQPFSAITRTT